MEQIIDFFKGFNVQTILSIFVMLWYFTSHIESKLEKQSQSTDRLYEMFIDLLKENKK
jgi:hypothetical protein